MGLIGHHGAGRLLNNVEAMFRFVLGDLGLIFHQSQHPLRFPGWSTPVTSRASKAKASLILPSLDCGDANRLIPTTWCGHTLDMLRSPHRFTLPASGVEPGHPLSSMQLAGRISYISQTSLDTWYPHLNLRKPSVDCSTQVRYYSLPTLPPWTRYPSTTYATGYRSDHC